MRGLLVVSFVFSHPVKVWQMTTRENTRIVGDCSFAAVIRLKV
jgi:hypothetical protein